MEDTLYHSVNDLPILVFYEILKEGDYSLLGKHESPEEVWLNIYDEYCIASNVDNSNIKSLAKIEGWKNKYHFIIGVLEILRHSYYLRSVEGFEENYQMAADKLRSMGYLFDSSKDFKEEFQRLVTQTESLLMKITIEEGNIDKTDKKLAINIWKEIVALERITSVKIEPKTDPIIKLIEVRNLGNEIIKQQRAA